MPKIRIKYDVTKLGVYILFAVLVTVIFREQGPFDAKSELCKILKDSQDAMSGLQAAIPNVITKQGIVAAELLSGEAFQQGKVNFWQCHILLHTIGHQAYSLYNRDLNRIAQDNLWICGNAYQHGVEAEIAVESDDAIRELYGFCEILRTKKPHATCYHGAGHAVMYETHDLEQALAYCERLKSIPTVENTDDCYTGVFSEYTLASDGIDGHTGLPLAGGPYVRIPFEHPLDFCQTLSLKYQYACAFQMSRILYRKRPPSDALKLCVEGIHPNDLKEACLRTVSAVVAREELYQKGNVDTPPFIASLKETFRKAYIWGIAKEFLMLKDSGLKKDEKKICAAFDDQNDKDYCLRLLTSQ